MLHCDRIGYVGMLNVSLSLHAHPSFHFRLLDQQEKEDFEARLRSKDEERTKKLASDSTQLTKAEQKEEKKRK